MADDGLDRIENFEKLLAIKKKHSNRLCWLRWDPNSSFGYEIEDAIEDVTWMIYEIRRLKTENKELRAFSDLYRDQMEKELSSLQDKTP